MPSEEKQWESTENVELEQAKSLLRLGKNATGSKGTDELVYDTKLKYAEIIAMLFRRRNEQGNSYAKNLVIGTALSAVLAACWATVEVITYIEE